MNAFLISTSGFSVSEVLVFRSIMRILQPTLSHQWLMIDDEAAADVVFIMPPGGGSGVRRHQVAIRSEHFEELGFTEVFMVFPFHSNNLIKLFNRVSEAASFQLKKSLCEVEDVLVKTASTITQIIQSLTSENLQSNLLVEIDGGPEFQITGMGAHRIWSCRGGDPLQKAAALIKGGAAVKVSDQPFSVVDTNAETGPLSTLIWHLAIADPYPVLRQSVAKAKTIRLLQWPDADLLGHSRTFMRMTALMTKGPIAFNDFIRILNVPMNEAVGFVNACDLAHLLEFNNRDVSQVADNYSPATVSPVPVNEPAPQPAVVQARVVSRGLLGRLRSALGIPA